jgi:hypothetical protein
MLVSSMGVVDVGVLVVGTCSATGLAPRALLLSPAFLSVVADFSSGAAVLGFWFTLRSPVLMKSREWILTTRIVRTRGEAGHARVCP